MKLLLNIANYLSDNSMIKKDNLKNFVDDFATGKVDYISNGDFVYYRKYLKEQVSEVNSRGQLTLVSKEV
jgi:regulator of sigma D